MTWGYDGCKPNDTLADAQEEADAKAAEQAQADAAAAAVAARAAAQAEAARLAEAAALEERLGKERKTFTARAEGTVSLAPAPEGTLTDGRVQLKAELVLRAEGGSLLAGQIEPVERPAADAEDAKVRGAEPSVC